jgi:thiol-disulfide isomerase/thioredoxin
MKSYAAQNQQPRVHMKSIREYLFIVIVSALAGNVATSAELPRYKFATGQELVYSGSSDFNFGTGAFKNSDITSFWVTGQNKDGSWHLVFIGRKEAVRTGDFVSTNDSTSFGHLDLLPDGRSVDKPAQLSEQQVYPAFFPLPADTDQVKTGWQFAENEAKQTVYRVKQTGKTWIIESTEQGMSGAGQAETVKAAARQALQSAAARVQNTALQDKIKSDLKNLDANFRYAQEENDHTDSVVNKPAPTWTTTDLDGQKHALEDYRGKVVALDFWYRGCGWCMRAMPQIKALADQFRGQPVVILGMNTDQQDKDAKFVVDKLQLNYPTLHATGIPEKYDVQGFPTFIVIDQKGIVRARHVGYSPTLREEMAKTISNLLSDNK